MVEQTALAIRKPVSMIRDYSDVERAAKAMAGSGYFLDSREANQAVVKILAGQEMGFGAFASMNGIHIIKGKPGVGANLQAAAVKGSGKYDYKIREITDKVCRLEFFEGKESLGISEFTLEDARKAGTQNLDKFPRNMLFARAMSNGVKWFTPDVFNGATVYTPEELGVEVNEDGQPINAEWKPEPVAPMKTTDARQTDPKPADLEQSQPEMPITYALQFQTADKRYLKDLSLEELEANHTKALAVAESKRSANWHKAMDALELVIRYREDQAERAAMEDDMEAGIDPKDGMPFGDK